MKWINADKRKPEKEGYYIVIVEHQKYEMKWIRENYYDPSTGWTDVYNLKVIYWIPEPEFSEEEV